MQASLAIRTLNANLRRLFAIGKSSSLQGRFLRATSGSIALKLVGVLLKLVASVLLARTLGAGQLGVYAFALSMVTIAAIPVDVGLPNLVTRTVAGYLSLSNWSAMRGLLLRANQLVLGISLFVMLLAASVSLSMDISRPVLYTFLVALAYLPFDGLGSLRRSGLIGLQRPILAQLPESIVQPALFVVLIGVSALLMNQAEFTPAVAMSLQILSLGAAFIVGHVLLFCYLPTQVKQVSASFETSEWLRGAVAFMFLGGLGTLNAQAGILMLGFFSSTKGVGIYKVVVTLAGLVIFVLRTVNLQLSAVIAKLYVEGDKERLQNIVTFASRLILLCGLPASIVFIFFGKWLLIWLYGAEFSQGASALAILCVGQLANAALGPVGLILNMSGHERDTIKGQVIGAVLNVVLGVVLIPVWGMEGAALATTCSLITWNIILTALVRRRLDLHVTAFGKVSLTRAT